MRRTKMMKRVDQENWYPKNSYKPILVEKMEDDHLLNAVRKLQEENTKMNLNRALWYPSKDMIKLPKVYSKLLAEVKKRGLTLKPPRVPYSEKYLHPGVDETIFTDAEDHFDVDREPTDDDDLDRS